MNDVRRYRPGTARLLVLVTAVACCAWGLGTADAGESATVTITIDVQPSASVSLPSGSDFVLNVPAMGPGRSFVPPVTIPFEIRTNVISDLSVSPSAHLDIVQQGFLGRAEAGGNAAMGYGILVQFPASGWLLTSPEEWATEGPTFPGFASLTGVDGEGTTPIRVGAAREESVPGIIYIVAKPNWTEDGRPARAGAYAGSVKVELVPH